MTLRDPDFRTANKIKNIIKETVTNLNVTLLNNKIIEIDITESIKDKIPQLMSQIQNLEVCLWDIVARILQLLL